MEFDRRKDRRSQLRVPAGEGAELTAELIVGPGRVYGARVVDTSANGVRLGFARRAPGRMHMGTVVEVRFCRVGVAKPLVALGQVAHQAPVTGEGGSGGAELGVRFTRREEFYRQLTPELWEQFNRRRRARVRFTGEKTPGVRIESGGVDWKGRLFDISEQGMGLDLQLLVAEDLADYELVRVRLKLARAGVIDMAGLRVHQTEYGRGVRHGLVFDPVQTPDFNGQQARIEAFVREVAMTRRV